MDTVAQNGAPVTLAELPMAEDGLIDFRKLAIGLVPIFGLMLPTSAVETKDASRAEQWLRP